MSYGFSAAVTPGPSHQDGGQQLYAAMDEAQQQAGEWGPETRHQASAAVNAAIALWTSGALGDLPLEVAISGHANPHHQHTPETPSEGVSITVRQIPTAL